MTVGLTLLFLAAAAPVRGDVWEFTIDPARSRVGAVAALYGGTAVVVHGTPQAPGSDAASFAGVLRVEASGGTIHFLDGSFADAQPHPEPMLPGPRGANAAQADYAWVGPSAPSGPAPRTAAVRDLRFDFFSNPIDYRPSDGGFPTWVWARVGAGRIEGSAFTATTTSGRRRDGAPSVAWSSLVDSG